MNFNSISTAVKEFWNSEKSFTSDEVTSTSWWSTLLN